MTTVSSASRGGDPKDRKCYPRNLSSEIGEAPLNRLLSDVTNCKTWKETHAKAVDVGNPIAQSQVKQAELP